MAQETHSFIENLLIFLSKFWMVVSAPFLGIALKYAIELRMKKRIPFREALISSAIGLIVGWSLGYFMYSMYSDNPDKAIQISLGVGVTGGLLGEKAMLYFYENLPAILDAFIAKFTGKPPKRK